MFTEDFNPVAALAACRCPRCAREGLAPIQEATYLAAPPGARVVSASIEPSVYAQCAACGAVMEWPGCMPE